MELQGGRTMMSMKKTAAAFLASLVAVGLGWSTAFAETPPATAPPSPAATPKPATLGLAVYPGSGQDATQQGKDEGECYAWAKQQTGIDPTAAPAPAAAADAPKGGAVKGAARGAARGAAVGAIGEDDRVRDEGNLDAGEGAAAGAVAGAARGRRAQRKAGKQAEAQAQQAAQAQDAAAKDTFKKAWGACLEGRGYSVK
jgi:hypothetical protein